jgi:hypothetical protein
MLHNAPCIDQLQGDMNDNSVHTNADKKQIEFDFIGKIQWSWLSPVEGHSAMNALVSISIQIHSGIPWVKIMRMHVLLNS